VGNLKGSEGRSHVERVQKFGSSELRETWDVRMYAPKGAKGQIYVTSPWDFGNSGL
jgi:hypothetical protein